GRLTAPLRQQSLPPSGAIRNALQMLFTFALVCFAWIFFRAESVSDAFYVVNHLFQGLHADVRAFLHGGDAGLPPLRIPPRLGAAALLLLAERWAEQRREIIPGTTGAPVVVRYAIYFVVILLTVLA